MKRIAIATILWALSITAYALAPSAAFFYGPNVPVRKLQLFNTVVVEPGYVPNPKKNETSQSHWYAHIETKNLTLKKIQSLWAKGYRGFFLDNSELNNATQKQKFIDFIKTVKKHYPSAKLIVNQSYSLLPAFHSLINGVVSKPLYQDYNARQRTYVTVSQLDRGKRLLQLEKAKRYGLNTYVIEYLPLVQQKKARLIAKKISNQGFIPWVSDSKLKGMGVSSIHIIPREIMMFYSSKKKTERIIASPLQYLANPLDYMGYVPKLYDAEKPLRGKPLINQVAGIVVWLDKTPFLREKKFVAWLKGALQKKIPVVIMSSLDYYTKDKMLLKRLKLKLNRNSENKRPFHFSLLNKQQIGFEIKPTVDETGFHPLTAKDATVLLQIESANGHKMDVAAITSWGGYVLAPYIIDTLPNKQTRYIINPFIFLQKALRLTKIPIPDVTTENGRRILITHIDGDGFYSRSEWPRGPYAGETLLKTILNKYRIPTTVSVVEGEVGSTGLKPKEAPKLEKIARSIFELPWVEIANHSYSHPFFWRKATKNTGKQMGDDSVERLNIPNYKFSLDREIIVSTHDINTEMAPPGKKCKVFLWSGDTDPPPEAVGMAYAAGLLNMNNGNTIMSRDYPSLTMVTALGVYKGKYLQIFAPIQNENMYTNEWLGPFFGFKRVIETFKMTNKPRRLKPINIYYHFYSASKVSALEALDFVYDWSLKQPVTPKFSSEYIRQVQDYYQLAIAKSNDDWLVHGNGHVREFRMPGTKTFPQLNASVMGFNTINGDHYMHTTGDAYHQIRMQKLRPNTVYLHDSNALLLSYKHEKNNYTWKLKSYIPLIANFSNSFGCHFSVNGQPVISKKEDKSLTITLAKEREATIQANC